MPYIIATLLIILSGVVLEISSAFHEEPGKICVESKDISLSHNSSKYLIFDKNNEVYEITDSIIYRRWNSSNVYASIKEGKCYYVTLQGYRIPFLSMYPNVINPELSKD